MRARARASNERAQAQIKQVCADACAYCAERGVDLSKLALHFSLAEPSIPTTLVSTASSSRITGNIQVIGDRPTSVAAAVVILHSAVCRRLTDFVRVIVGRRRSTISANYLQWSKAPWRRC
eukprot:COSAG01_NODE_372_length_17995_cov_16.957812_6_plen_121_part_00